MSIDFYDVIEYRVPGNAGTRNWAFDYIYFMANEGIVNGTGVNTFSPGSNTTVAQFCKMAILAADIDGEQYGNWSETNPLGWSKNYIDYAIDNGYFDYESGLGAKNYTDYNVPIRREFAFYIAWKAFGEGGRRATTLTDKTGTFLELGFTDSNINSIVKEEYKPAIVRLYNSNIVTGYNDGELKPMSFITRAEVCAILYRIIKIDEYEVTGTGVNVRESHDINSTILGMINYPGDPTKVIKGGLFPNEEPQDTPKGNYVWVKIHYYNPSTNKWVLAWVSKEYLRPVQEKTESIEGVVYAITSTDILKRLEPEERRANAEYIYRYLRYEEGWTKNAICGLLGNIHHESWFNPGVWQSLNNPELGYGIIQLSPFPPGTPNPFLSHAGLTVATANEMATGNPIKLMNLQLECLIWECQPTTHHLQQQWWPDQTQKYYDKLSLTPGIPGKISFAQYTAAEYSVRDLTLIFHATRLRSGDDATILEERIDYADDWDKHFSDWR